MILPQRRPHTGNAAPWVVGRPSRAVLHSADVSSEPSAVSRAEHDGTTGPAAEARTEADVAGTDRLSTAEGRLARLREACGFPVTFFVAVGVVLFVVVWASNTYMTRNPSYPIQTPLSFSGDGVLEGWVRYDGGWYRYIADIGYFYDPSKQSPVAFFPAYPMGMRALALVLRDSLLAGVLLTFVCGLGTAVLVYRWAARQLSPRTARLTVALMFLFPYAWFLYGAVYADALFLVCTVGAFVLVERDRPVLAGLAAGLATAARPIGMGVLVGIVVVGLEHRGVIAVPILDRVKAFGWRRAFRRGEEDRGSPLAPRQLLSIRLRRLRLGDAGLLLSISGLVAWCAYLSASFGEPFAFVKVEGAPGWDQAQGPATWFKTGWFEHLGQMRTLIRHPETDWYNFTYTLGITAQGLLCIGCFLLIPLVIRRIGWSYAVLTLMVVAIPAIGTKDWQGTGRYLLAAFPVFAALADWLIESERVWLRNAIVLATGASLVFLTSAYARGYYLA